KSSSPGITLPPSFDFLAPALGAVPTERVRSARGNGRVTTMRRIHWVSMASVILVTLGGCASGPLLDNPVFIGQVSARHVENPIYVPLGPPSYGLVFEKVLEVVGEYFEIRYSNRYDGRIITFPKIAPGLGQPWKPGSPDLYQRFEATLQTIRHRGEIEIQTAEDGGFFVHVTVYKELEDLATPSRATAGAATFRSDVTVDRQFEIIDAPLFEATWIPIGRNIELEQVILERIKKCM